MKVLLCAINSQYIHTNLAVRYLKAYTNDLDYECIIKEFTINERVNDIFNEIIEQKADIVAFSCYIWNAEYVIKLSKLIRLLDYKIEILYGGPEVSYECEAIIKKSYVDYIIKGEGEETYREFIIYKLKANDLKNINGLYSKFGSNIYYGGEREPLDMNKLIFPYDEKENLENRIIYYEASRGCPFSCSYCLSSTIKGVRSLNVMRVKNDLQFFIDKKVKLVKFVDRTFNAKSEYAREIWKYIIENSRETKFHCEICADILTDEDLKLLQTARKGIMQFEVGVQTTNVAVLSNIDRKMNINKLKENVVIIRKNNNIAQHMDLIAGLPGEDLESFSKSFDEVYELSPNELQLGFLKLLKGSKMRMDAEKWGIKYSPYSPYEIIESSDMSFGTLNKLRDIEAIVDKYYNSGKFNNIIKYLMRKFQSAFELYNSVSEFFKTKGYYNRKLSFNEYYYVLLEYYNESFEDDSSVMKDIIKFDYINQNRKKSIPSFLEFEISKKTKNDVINKYKQNSYDIDDEKYIFVSDFKIDINELVKNDNIVNNRCFVVFSGTEPDTGITLIKDISIDS